MKRIQLFEFEDFNWFPRSIRSAMTNLIVVFHKMTGTQEVVESIVEPILGDLDEDKIVDMGSGSGGIMPAVLRSINDKKENKVKLLLTDLHPNPQIVLQYDQTENMAYQAESFNACNLEQAPKGLKTMMNSFHHMPPEIPGSILKSASDAKQPILIYEMGQNNIPLVLWWLFLPISLVIIMLMVLFMTPFVRPMTWQQIVFTYLIPVIPICYAWDGQASLVRMYTFDDLRFLLNKNRLEENGVGYQWTIKSALKPNGNRLGYYIYGRPKNA
ncbi:MAG: hypothetical protein ACPG21_06325 [Crocinitomicaceae bacterium]